MTWSRGRPPPRDPDSVGAIKDKRFTLHKEKGEDNIADLGTKQVVTQTMWRLLKKMGIYAAAGRSKLAPKAAL